MPRGRPKVPRVTVKCFVCGKPKEMYLSQVQQNTSGRFFCSKEHLHQVGAKPRRREMRTCEQCGEQFYPKQETQRFHDRACADEWQRRAQVELVCEGCGRSYLLSPSQAKHRTGRFCSRACEAESRIKRPLNRTHNGRPAVLDRSGYVRIFEPDHPKATGGGWIYEHRLVMETFLGRTLERHEHVHHINGKKDDNRLENLVAMDHLEHLVLSGTEHRTALAEMQAELAEYRKRFGSLETP